MDPFIVHPQVLLSITDHYLRENPSLLGGGAPRPSSLCSLPGATHADAIGLLFGVQVGPVAELLTSTELKLATPGEGGELRPVLDPKFLSSQKELMLAVFPNYELLGWYCTTASGEGLETGRAVSAAHVELHAQLAQHVDSPLLLMLSLDVAQGARALPMAVFSGALSVGGALPRAEFRIDSSECERLTVDAVLGSSGSRSGVVGDPPSEWAGWEGGWVGCATSRSLTFHSPPPPPHPSPPVVDQLLSTSAALTGLLERLDRLAGYAEDVAKGVLPPDPAALRALAGVLARLPVDASPELAVQLTKDATDTMLAALTSSLVRGVSSLHEVVSLERAAGEGEGAAARAKSTRPRKGAARKGPRATR